MKTTRHIYSALVLIVFAILFFASSAPKALTGKYQDTPYVIHSTKPFDTVWSDVIDLFATKGYTIKMMDKSDGLIMTEKYSFLNVYTFENKKGQLVDTNAIVVVTRSQNAIYRNPTDITGSWNVRIKSAGDKTIININIVNLTAQTVTPSHTDALGNDQSRTYNLEVKSTGVFERTIGDILKRGNIIR